MGALSGSMSTRKFYVRGEVPDNIRQAFEERISLRAFRPLQPEEEAEERFGWCGLGQPSDLSPSTLSVFRDGYVTLGLRMDQYRFPSAVVQAKLQEATAEKLKREGSEKLTRPETAELKERVLLDLRRQFLPTMRMVDMVWNLDRQEVQFWSQSAGPCDKLTALFELTFGLELVGNSPYIAAREVITDKTRLARLDQVQPTPVHGA